MYECAVCVCAVCVCVSVLICTSMHVHCATNTIKQQTPHFLLGPGLRETMERQGYPKVLPTITPSDLRKSTASLADVNFLQQEHPSQHQHTLDSGRGTLGSNKNEWRNGNARQGKGVTE